MARRLPPLNSLRAFEAAARNLSFTRAAKELHVTQAAVSHQVKALEANLEVRLFHRLNRSLALTERGEDYLPAVRRAFDLLAEATEQLRGENGDRKLTVSVMPSFAARWLVPRLGRFAHAHPDIDARVDAVLALVDFVRDDVDVAIRYGRGHYPGLRADRLMTEDIFPVCSPELCDGDHPLREPADLINRMLLHDDDHSDWRRWLLAVGDDAIDPTRGTVFSDSSLLVQAAVAGQGVAMARGALARDDLTAGRLVRPFDLSLPSEFAYYLVCPEETADRPKVSEFREWILDEARRSDEQS